MIFNIYLGLFLDCKDDAFDAFKTFCKRVQTENGYVISCIRSDHGREFENHAFESFCNDFGIEHQFSSPRTPQKNGVVEIKNMTIQKMAKTMLNENSLPKYFGAEVVNTTCSVLNHVLIRLSPNKTPYELWKDRNLTSIILKSGCKCFILNTKENLGKFDPKSDVAIVLGYSTSSKFYRVYNKKTMVVEESMHVIFFEFNLGFSTEYSLLNLINFGQFLIKLSLDITSKHHSFHLNRFIIKKGKIVSLNGYIAC